MALFIKSITWLLGTGGFSYILYKTITPDENELRKYLPQGQVHHNPKLNNQPLFMESLKKAALEKKSMVKKGTESEAAKSSNTPNLVEK